jgi:mannose-6-phosphate isomerase
MKLVSGAHKHYDWGDHQFLYGFVGAPLSSKPLAEIWFGTHADGPAVLSATQEALSNVAGPLPFMVKFLSAASPLSLQVHPTASQARAGFVREESAGIPASSLQRIYRDSSDKPELLIALTSFTALCGFHDVASSVGWFRAMQWTDLADYLEQNGLHAFAREALEGNTLRIPAQLPPWANEIRAAFPNDPALLIALLMHRVELAAGECLLLEAGTLHAYLKGSAIEVMNTSDNVVRGGFTLKHIDTAELLSVTSWETCPHPVRRASNAIPGISTYPTTGAFKVQSITAPAKVPTSASAQLVACIAGSGPGFSCGQVALLAANEEMQLTGDCVVIATTSDTQH